MKICKYCGLLYDENEYHHGKDFCCLVHYKKHYLLNDYEYCKLAKTLTPQEAYFEIDRGINDIDVDKSNLYFNMIAKCENLVEEFLSNADALLYICETEFLNIINAFGISYTMRIMQIVINSADIKRVLKFLSKNLDSIEKDKREIVESFIMADLLGGNDK